VVRVTVEDGLHVVAVDRLSDSSTASCANRLVLLAGLEVVVAEDRDRRHLRGGELAHEHVRLLRQAVVGEAPARRSTSARSASEGRMNTSKSLVKRETPACSFSANAPPTRKGHPALAQGGHRLTVEGRAALIERIPFGRRAAERCT